LLIPTEIKLVFEELETPRQQNATGGVWLGEKSRQANPTTRMRMAAAKKQINLVVVVIAVILVRAQPNAEVSDGGGQQPSESTNRRRPPPFARP
jgi:hypothetical protein